MNKKTLDEQINNFIEYFEVKSQDNVKFSSTLKSLFKQMMEEVIGKTENIGLPVTQAQEQSNYNKKQRNYLRKEQNAKLEELLKGGE